MTLRAVAVALALSGAGCAKATAVRAAGDVRVVTARVAYNNAHAVTTPGGVVLVDAGLEADAPALDAALRAAGVDMQALRAVVVTHGHADHAGGAGWFRARYGAPIVAGRGDAGMLSSGVNEPLCPTDAIGRARLSASQGATYTPITPDVWVDDAADLAALGAAGRVVSVPGHTEGSLVVVVGDVVIVGDLLRGAVLGRGARTHFYMCDLPGNVADVRAVLHELAPDAKDVYVGHFGPLTREAVSAWLEAQPAP